MTKKTVILSALALIATLILAAATWVLLPRSDENANGEPAPVTLGVMLPLSGDASFLGKSMQKGLDLAVKKAGLPNVTLIIEDTQCKAENTLQAMNYLVQSGAVAVIGEACSGATLSAAPIAEHNRVVLISPASTSPEISNAGDYIFRTAPSDKSQSVCASKLLKTKGYAKVAVLYSDEPYGVGYADSLLRNIEEGDGAETTAIGIQFNPGSLEFTEQTEKISGFGAEAAYIITNSQSSMAAAIRQIRTDFPEMPILGAETLTEQNLIDQIGELSDGLTAVTFSMGSPEFQQMHVDAYGEQPNIFAAQAYDAYMVLAKAIAAGEASKKSLRSAIINTDYEGASGHVKFDAFGDMAGGCFMTSVHGGKVAVPTAF